MGKLKAIFWFLVLAFVLWSFVLWSLSGNVEMTKLAGGTGDFFRGLLDSMVIFWERLIK